MEAKPYIKAKLKGRPRDLEQCLQQIRKIFFVTQTSRIIQHSEDDLAHVYLLLIDPINNGKELKKLARVQP